MRCLASASLFAVIQGIFAAPCVFVLIWLIDAVPLVHTTQPEPEQPTFHAEMVLILIVLVNVVLYYILYTLLSLAQKRFPEKFSLEYIF